LAVEPTRKVCWPKAIEIATDDVADDSVVAAAFQSPPRAKMH